MNKVAQLFAAAFGLMQLDPIASDFAQAEKLRIAKDNNLGHKGTPPHGFKMRGKGYTRSSKEESKTRRVMASNSRRINRHK